AFRGVHGLPLLQAIGGRGQQATLRGDGRRPGVEQHEVAGAVGVLGFARCKTGLPEEGRLLIAEVRAHGYDAADRTIRLRLPVDLLIARRPDLGQHGPRDLDLAQQLRVPIQRLEVHQHGARRVAVVGAVRPTLGPTRQPPDDPGIDVAEQKVPTLGRRAGARNVVEDPLDFRPGEIGGDDKTGLALDQWLDTVVDQLLTDVDRARVLPHDRVVDRLPGLLLPDHRGLALVGDADARDLVGLDPAL